MSRCVPVYVFNLLTFYVFNSLTISTLIDQIGQPGERSFTQSHCRRKYDSAHNIRKFSRCATWQENVEWHFFCQKQAISVGRHKSNVLRELPCIGVLCNIQVILQLSAQCIKTDPSSKKCPGGARLSWTDSRNRLRRGATFSCRAWAETLDTETEIILEWSY